MMARKVKFRIFFLLTLSIASVLPVSGQETDRVLVDLADEMYDFGDYADALGIYLQALEENPTNIRANYMVGSCYLKTTAEKDKAIGYLLEAYRLDPEIAKNILFEIAEAYRFDYNFDEAIRYFKAYKEELETDRRKFANDDVEYLKSRTSRRIEVCENAKIAVANPVTVRLRSLGPVVNSEYDDYAPALSKDNQVLIFTSKRSGGVSMLKDKDNKFFEDIYISNKEGGEWQEATSLDGKVNSEFHDATISLSPDGDRLYIYKTDNKGDIYVSTKGKDGWEKAKALDAPVNSEYRESSIYEVADGQRIFFTSSRPGGAGGSDIYVGYKNSKGKYETIERLSDVVNTKYDEESPFYDEANSTLYFSSKGHNSMGNFDIFKTVFNEATGRWSEPENLGYPINSSDDDLHYILLSDGVTAYFSSYKEDSQGGLDIYLIAPYVRKDTVVAQSVQAPLMPANLKMNIYDNLTDEPVNPMVKIVDVRTDSVLSSGYAVNGKYESWVKPFMGGDVVITMEADGYLYQTVKMNINHSTDTLFISKNVAMRKPKVKQINVLRNIYFGFDQFTLRPASHNELDILTEMLKSNPEMRIEIAGHTDYIGTDEYNYDLSVKRAKAVQNFLIKNGISEDRLEVKGYGKTKPMATNDQEIEGRELNRRTEFIILTK